MYCLSIYCNQNVSISVFEPKTDSQNWSSFVVTSKVHRMRAFLFFGLMEVSFVCLASLKLSDLKTKEKTQSNGNDI